MSRDIARNCRDMFDRKDSPSSKNNTDRSFGEGGGPGAFRGPDGTLNIRKGWTPGKNKGAGGSGLVGMPCQRTPPKNTPGNEKFAGKGSLGKKGNDNSFRGRQVGRGKSATIGTVGGKNGRNGKSGNSDFVDNKDRGASSY